MCNADEESEKKPAAKRSRTERSLKAKPRRRETQERHPAPPQDGLSSRVPRGPVSEGKQDESLRDEDARVMGNRADGQNLSQLARADQSQHLGVRPTDDAAVAAFASQMQNALETERERASRIDLLARILRPQQRMELQARPSSHTQLPFDVLMPLQGIGSHLSQHRQPLPPASYSLLPLHNQPRGNLQSIFNAHNDPILNLPMLGLPVMGSNPYFSFPSRDPTSHQFPLALQAVAQAGAQDSMRQLSQVATEPGAALPTSSTLSPLDRQTASTDLEASQQQPSVVCKFHTKIVAVSAVSDRESVSKLQALLRDQLFYFAAVALDVQASAQGRNKPIRLGQVGLMCRHCCNVLPRHRPRGAVYFPQKLSGIYQSAQNMLNNHYSAGGGCPNAPATLHEGLREKRGDKSIVYGGGQQYWARTAARAGVVETEDGLTFQADDAAPDAGP